MPLQSVIAFVTLVWLESTWERCLSNDKERACELNSLRITAI
jgi:hypothetical protein